MPNFSNSFRRLTSKHRLKIFLLAICLYNYSLLTIHSHYNQAKCSSDLIGDVIQYESGTESKNDKKFLLQEFAWGEEIREVAEDIVMLEYDSSKRTKSVSSFPPLSEILPPIKKEFTSEIVALLQKNYYVMEDMTSLDEYTVSYESGAILDCDAINRLERRQISPKIVHIATEKDTIMGEYYLNNGLTTNIVKKTFRRADRGHGNQYQWTKIDQEFKLAQEELLKLLMLHGYPFVPRLYGVCLSLSNGSDVTKLKNMRNADVRSISFATDRFDSQQMRICKESQLSRSEEECLQLTALSKLIISSVDPINNALLLMSNIANAFATLHSVGILPTDVNPYDIIITKNFEITFTSVESFVILQTNSDSIGIVGHNRLFSSTMCKDYQECSNNAIKGMMFKIGQACKEMRGYCADDNRCWGIDNAIYACVMSRWLFAKIHNGIPSSWEYDASLTKLLYIARQASPEHRCDWSTLSRGLNDLLDKINIYE